MWSAAALFREEFENMTVYVDNFRVRATVGGTRGRWSHLTADTVEELHEFAVTKLGLRREWFQARCKYGKCREKDGVCVHFHYDVTDRVRNLAIVSGATALTLSEFGGVISARRPQFQAPAV